MYTIFFFFIYHSHTGHIFTIGHTSVVPPESEAILHCFACTTGTCRLRACWKVSITAFYVIWGNWNAGMPHTGMENSILGDMSQTMRVDPFHAIVPITPVSTILHIIAMDYIRSPKPVYLLEHLQILTNYTARDHDNVQCSHTWLEFDGTRQET